MNGLAGMFTWLDGLGIFFASYAGLVLVAILIFIWIHKRSRRNLITLTTSLVAALVSRFVIVEIIRFFYDKARPFEVLDVVQLINRDPGGSLPSGHASFFFAFSTIVFFYNKKLGVIFLTVSTLIGLARVFVGVHWPIDILVGTGIGIGVGYVVFAKANKKALL